MPKKADDFEVWMAGHENAYIQFGSRSVPYAAYRIPASKEAIDFAIPLIEHFESVWAGSSLGEGAIVGEARKRGAEDWKDPKEWLGDRNGDSVEEAEQRLPTADVRRQEGQFVRTDYELGKDEVWASEIARDLGLADGVEFCQNCGYELVFHPSFFNPKTKKKVSDRLVCHHGCKDGKGYPLTVWLGD